MACVVPSILVACEKEPPVETAGLIAFNGVTAPPNPFVEARFTADGPRVVSFTVSNSSEGLLRASASLIADPVLCPTLSSSFSLSAPAFAVPPFASVQFDVSFSGDDLTEGQCAVLDIATNSPTTPRLKAVLILDDDAFVPFGLCAPTNVVDFGPTLLNVPARRFVEVQSCNGDPVTVLNVSLAGSGAFQLDNQLTLPLTLSGGETAGVNVDFLPEVEGPNVGSFVNFQTPEGTLSISLTGQGFIEAPQCVVVADVSRVDFASTALALTARRDVTVRNVGGVACTDADVSFGSGGSGSFEVDDVIGLERGGALQPQTSATYQITYAPSGDALDTDELNILFENAAPIVIPMSGRPSQGNCLLEISPSGVDFPARALVRDDAKTITIRNIETDNTCVVGNFRLTDPVVDFEIVPPVLSPVDLPGLQAGVALAPGASTSLLLVRRDALVAGTLTLAPSAIRFDEVEAQTYEVPVNRVFAQPCVEVIPRRFDLAPLSPGGFLEETLTVQNCGQIPVHVDRIGVVGVSSPGIRVTGEGAPTVVGVGGTVNMTVRVARGQGPADDGPDVVGTIEVRSDASTVFVPVVSSPAPSCPQDTCCVKIACAPR